MTDNTDDWGMYYVPTQTIEQPKPTLASQFKEGWEACLGLHLLEGVN